MRRRSNSLVPPTLADNCVCIEVPADCALAAREFISEPVGGLSTDHPALAFFAAWDKEIADAQAQLAMDWEDHVAALAGVKAEEAARGARDFLLTVMRGEAEATATQIAAAEALVRATT